MSAESPLNQWPPRVENGRAGSKLLSAERVDASKPEVWSVEFSASKLFLRLGDPIPFLFSTSSTNVMRERGLQGEFYE